MTPLQAARELEGVNLPKLFDYPLDCFSCGGHREKDWNEDRPGTVVAWGGYFHWPACPWLQITQVVRTLELVETWRRAKLHALAIRDDRSVPYGSLTRANAARALLSAEEMLLQATDDTSDAGDDRPLS